jgi:hypothetical protein
MQWEYSTFPRSHEVLDELSKKQRVLNINCKDTSKTRVDEVHKAVFGYSLAIDPLTYKGLCVKKSNKQTTRNGVIVPCPVDEVDEKSVYQIVVNNKINDDYVEDIRVPIVGDNIPFCYLKRRPVQRRFGTETTSSNLCERDAVLSTTEVELLLRLCRRMGLDYGELDVLRDSDSKRLYVVDVNNTPVGPPKHLDSKSVHVALERLSKAFMASFMPSD